MLFLPHDWRLALATVLLAGLFDVTIGEPPSALHPVVWMGRLIGALMGRRPHGRPRAELAYGVLIVLVTAGSAAAAGLLLTIGLSYLPWWAALPLGAWVLKTAFSLRGLVRAGRDVQRALGSDTGAARARLAALVSRSPDMDPPLIVSATVESLAENLTDSVVSPLFFFVFFGLPGALAYRAINTMDAMIGYRDEREYVGKAAARTDDVANWAPTRIAALMIVAVWLLGVGTLKDLSLVLLIGILAGTYSSIFFATPLLVTLRERTELVRNHTRRVLNRRKAGAAPTESVSTVVEESAEPVDVGVASEGAAEAAEPVRPARPRRPSGKRER